MREANAAHAGGDHRSPATACVVIVERGRHARTIRSPGRRHPRRARRTRPYAMHRAPVTRIIAPVTPRGKVSRGAMCSHCVRRCMTTSVRSTNSAIAFTA